jgi:hypothetical protein
MALCDAGGNASGNAGGNASTGDEALGWQLALYGGAFATMGIMYSVGDLAKSPYASNTWSMQWLEEYVVRSLVGAMLGTAVAIVWPLIVASAVLGAPWYAAVKYLAKDGNKPDDDTTTH